MQKFDFAYVCANSIPEALKLMVDTCLKQFGNNPRAEMRQIFMLPEMRPVATKTILKPDAQPEYQQVIHLIAIVGEIDPEVSEQLKNLQNVIVNDLPGALAAMSEISAFTKGIDNPNMPA
jgi:hypothetical protein